MKSAKPRSKSRHAGTSARNSATSVEKPVTKWEPPAEAVIKAALDTMLDSLPTPEERYSFLLGVQDAKKLMAGHSISELTPELKANVILAMVDGGSLGLEEAERWLISLQTEANGGVPVDEEQKRKAVAAIFRA